MRRAVITVVLLLTAAGAMVLTGATTKGTRGFCIDGPEGGYCETESFVNWSGELLIPTLLAPVVVIALALWWLRDTSRALVVAAAATGVAAVVALISVVSYY